MSLLFFLVAILLVTGASVAVAVAFARAVLYQNVLGELDVTRASRPARRPAPCAPPDRTTPISSAMPETTRLPGPTAARTMTGRARVPERAVVA